MQKSLFRRDLSALVFIHQYNMPSLLLCRLYKLWAKHNPTVSARRTVNLASVLRRSVDCNIHREAMADPVASLSMPTRYWFIDANSFGRRNGWRAMFDELGISWTDDGWILNGIHCQRSSKRLWERFVVPNNGAGMDVKVAVVAQRLRRSSNSNLVAKITTPKNLSKSPSVVVGFESNSSCCDVNRTIDKSDCGGNMERSSQDVT